MNKGGLTGVALTVVLALLGAWTLFSPFMTGHQLAGAAWTAATRSDVWIGGILLALSALSLLLSGTGHLSSLERAARRRPLESTGN